MLMPKILAPLFHNQAHIMQPQRRFNIILVIELVTPEQV